LWVAEQNGCYCFYFGGIVLYLHVLTHWWQEAEMSDLCAVGLLWLVCCSM
jgi:hypothetical protein